MSTALSARATVVGGRRLRPPKQLLYVDVEVTVPEAARWVVLPDTLWPGEESSWVPRRVHTVDRCRCGAVDVVRLIGERGGVAVPVGASHGLSVRGLPVAVWGELPAGGVMAVLSAREVRLGGRRLDDLFAGPLVPGATVEASTLDDSARVDRLEAPLDAPLDVEMDDAALVAVPVG